MAKRQVYFENWAGNASDKENKAAMLRSFDHYDWDNPNAEPKTKLPAGAKVEFAFYSYEDYSGYAWVVYTVKDKVYEVHGSHCSCNGLEGQWCPEETSWEFIAKQVCEQCRPDKWYDRFSKEAIDSLVAMVQSKIEGFNPETYENA